MWIFLGMIDLWETAKSPADRETGGAKNASPVYTPIRQQISLAAEMGRNGLAVLAARPVAPNNLTLDPQTGQGQEATYSAIGLSFKPPFPYNPVQFINLNFSGTPNTSYGHWIGTAPIRVGNLTRSVLVRSSGTVVTDPDYLSTWDVMPGSDDPDPGDDPDRGVPGS